MRAYLFPGQGSQFPGMGLDLYNAYPRARDLFEVANQTLGFPITDIMFGGTEASLQQTHVTQPAVFIYSTVLAAVSPDFCPDMVAGHSLGEFSALVASGVLGFEEGLRLVKARASLMQEACEQNPGTMVAILGLDDRIIEEVCAGVQGEVVVAANYNAPGQLVIAGTLQGVAIACGVLQQRGAKKIIPLKVGGGFHSPLMEPAKDGLRQAIERISFKKGRCPIYQNVTALPTTDPQQIKENLIEQLTAGLLWKQTIQRMVQDGASLFVACGPGKVLEGLVKRIVPEMPVSTLTIG
jgi:[acyl-carrier-protein] S-malonyltransferase